MSLFHQELQANAPCKCSTLEGYALDLCGGVTPEQPQGAWQWFQEMCTYLLMLTGVEAHPGMPVQRSMAC
jgi:hypothetical protein